MNEKMNMKLNQLLPILESGLIVRFFDESYGETIHCDFYRNIHNRMKMYGDCKVTAINHGDDDCDIEVVIVVE